MLNGLDLFSGIGGIAMALEPWVRPVAYCENDRYAQAVLLSRMAKGELPNAPIWDDVCSIDRDTIGAFEQIDIIYGGFPCQDISAAGRGVGMEKGSRSGLFFEIARLVHEIRPAFLFLENVPAIRTRGLSRVLSELTVLGYDSRWTTVSAAEVGAPHLRKRWFLLATDPERFEQRDFKQRETWGRLEIQDSWETEPRNNGETESLANTASKRRGKTGKLRCDQPKEWTSGSSEDVANPMRSGLEGQREESFGVETKYNSTCDTSWWTTEPDVGRVANGIPARVDRLRGLGNAVVPAQAREAFKRLCGLE